MQYDPDENRSGNGTIFDSSGAYRYALWRSWNSDPRIGFVMLNPNQADAELNDPTIRRCIGFAKSWGFGGLEVVNLFAYRAKTPQLLKQAAEPIGIENDRYLLTLAERVDLIILAWGNWGGLWQRDREVLPYFQTENSYSLGVTKLGHPKHPLYLRRDIDRVPWIAAMPCVLNANPRI
ncbi:MAG: DUF1643 domain-containing protein [Plectolyngbya sp. WJT66-NPBG17]|jgi:hypothetical protein|nr:DUF1643 domain-containing protein [Plectolyngbya sp. WJT66-NPBG17]